MREKKRIFEQKYQYIDRNDSATYAARATQE